MNCVRVLELTKFSKKPSEEIFCWYTYLPTTSLSLIYEFFILIHIQWMLFTDNKTGAKIFPSGKMLIIQITSWELRIVAARACKVTAAESILKFYRVYAREMNNEDSFYRLTSHCWTVFSRQFEKLWQWHFWFFVAFLSTFRFIIWTNLLSVLRHYFTLQN